MDNFIDYLYDQVNRAIYVLGAQGQDLSAMTNPEKWITDNETSSVNANRAIKLYRQRKAAGINPIRAFDCSGLIVYFLYDLHHAIPGDRNTKGLYIMSQKLDAPEKPGDLVWYSKTGMTDGISHVGVYVGDGKVIEAYGRDYGVIETKYTDRNWTFAGRMKQLEPYLPNDDGLSVVEVYIDKQLVHKFRAKKEDLT